ncbi:MAG: cytochrome d ubiquinol oxidase subunit II [Acidobacteriota bacterium]|nr:cytochrome d ubiquinol oxidase subunit II [Acidobacteriota bacterium]
MTFAYLNTTWFALIGLLWAGYLFLEGFDFGVAIVAPFISSDETDRRICLNSVGPVWDGNEVWLLVAGGATFAAFPLWYARLFNGFYLALFLVLVALIVRGVSFEYRNKVDDPRWRKSWDVANFVGSLIPAVIWGVAFTDFVHGVPIVNGYYTGGLWGALHPIALLGGAASLAVFVTHGALFLSLKTDGPISERARRLAPRSGVVAAGALLVTVLWLAVSDHPHVVGTLPGLVPLLFGLFSVAAVGSAALVARSGRVGWAFIATGLAIVAAMGAVFARMFPAVLTASNGAANTVTIAQAASQHNTLVVMTVVAACFTPFVLAYQGWTYWVFRQRLARPEPARRPGSEVEAPASVGGTGTNPVSSASGAHG